MKKYNIEGGCDFYEELYKLLDVEENQHKTEYDAKLCLITNEQLMDKFVEMNCGHKLNYVPLYLDIKNHKQKYNGMEATTGHLKQDEIRCPYCRKKQLGVLPYYEELGLPKIIGVNDICANVKTQSYTYSGCSYKPCKFLLSNPNFDPSGNNVVETSDSINDNTKFFTCGTLGCKIDYKVFKGNYKNGNITVDYPTPEVIDNNHYCWTHKKEMVKKYKKEILEKAKDAVKKIKLAEKMAINKAKEEAKQKTKDEKEQIKKLSVYSKKQVDYSKPFPKLNENQVIGVIDISGNNSISVESFCLEILKTGLKKGEFCGCKIFNDNMCKRHYNLKNKITNDK